MPASETPVKDPAECASMVELRAEIDALDRRLIDVLTRRMAYIDRAVELKRLEKLPARTTDRVAEVKAKARVNAEEAGLDPELAERIWHEMIEWAIDHEAARLGE